MKKLVLTVTFGSLVFFAAGQAGYAQDKGTTPALRQEMEQSRERLRLRHEEMKDDMAEGHDEEMALKDEIRKAREAGDTQKAEQLQEKFRLMHKERMGEHHEDMKGLRDERKEDKGELKEKRKEWKRKYNEEGEHTGWRERHRKHEGTIKEPKAGGGKGKR